MYCLLAPIKFSQQKEVKEVITGHIKTAAIYCFGTQNAPAYEITQLDNPAGTFPNTKKDKKAAKVLWTPAASPAKRLRHKRFPPLKGTPPIIPFPFGFPHCPYLFSAFFFPFLLEKCFLRQAG